MQERFKVRPVQNADAPVKSETQCIETYRSLKALNLIKVSAYLVSANISYDELEIKVDMNRHRSSSVNCVNN